MSKQNYDKKMPWKWYVGLVLGCITILLMITIVPIWEWFPVQITEQGKVFVIIKEGCVIQAQTVDLPVIQKCMLKWVKLLM